MKIQHRQRIIAADSSVFSDFSELLEYGLDSMPLLHLMLSSKSDQEIIKTLKSYIAILKEYSAQVKLSSQLKRSLSNIISNLENLIYYTPRRFDNTKSVCAITYCIDYIEEDLAAFY